MARRKWKTCAFVDAWLILQPQFHGIDVQFAREFVHNRFERVQPGHRARPAHSGRRTDMTLHKA
jgi:hypothetical protein